MVKLNKLKYFSDFFLIVTCLNLTDFLQNKINNAKLSLCIQIKSYLKDSLKQTCL